MKKFIIPFVIMAAAGIAAGIVAVNGQKATADEELPDDPDVFSGYGYNFNGTDTLSLGWFGDFILVDPEV